MAQALSIQTEDIMPDYKTEYLVGIDVGSTTTKIAAMDPVSEELVWFEYRRHGAAQLQSVQSALERCAAAFPGAAVRVALAGSGAKPIADLLGLPFTQELVANAVALRRLYCEIGTAIELGGQDAKMLFFRRDEASGELQSSDMRMNGSCAGGTGAFIDEVASILKLPVEELNALAERGRKVYAISGRCGVFAKTDIQPLLNQGVSREDIALSAFHAIAKQTIGGLAQGLEIRKPVVFEGGPLTFNPVLVQVFAERLSLEREEILIPEHPELLVACGAALSLRELHREAALRDPAALAAELKEQQGTLREQMDSVARPFFESEEEQRAFSERHQKAATPQRELPPGSTVRAYLGIDSGSTTTKFVLLAEDEELLDSFYAPNGGAPLELMQKALSALKRRYEERGVELQILAAGSTGYGEFLLQRAFDLECHCVETVAHARAAEKYVKDASFILDIGGQDMKAIWLDHGVITNIVVNEACSSGCGSFLENFAASLHIPVEQIADAAFSSAKPAQLGSRCTVFMNSGIITEQRNGKLPGDIMAGLCRSIIENVFTKVIRISNLSSLGERIVVQGGTFENDAVLRAMEQYVGREVVRAPYPGLMGAIGAALLTKEQCEAAGAGRQRSFIGLDGVERFSYTREADIPCPFCENHCRRTVLRFSDGRSWVTNNRCEWGELLGDPREEAVRKELKERESRQRAVPNLFQTRNQLLFREYRGPVPRQKRNITIGLPRVLAFWDTMPFWSSFFRSLGFRVVMSPMSTREMYEEGLKAVPSDTVCFPAKLVHGHIRALSKLGADRIFMPSVTVRPSENTEKQSVSMCAVVKGYPIVIRNSDNPEEQFGIPLDAPLFHWYTDADRERQLRHYMREQYGVGAVELRRAIRAGDRAQREFRGILRAEGARVRALVREQGGYAVVLAARPYQGDPLVNHALPELFTGMGIPVLTADSLGAEAETELCRSRIDIVNNYHARMLSSAMLAARSEELEYVQTVSFGCGHDAYLSDEIVRVMREISGKTPLILKLDESDAQGPLRIRVRSFVETVRMKRERGAAKRPVRALSDPYALKFTEKDAEARVVLVPNTSHAFSRVMAAAMSTQGLCAVPMELGGEEAIRLGKRYVHNDICFPAQIVIGEALSALRSGRYNPKRTAIAMGKYLGDCRLTHYSALLRKALDDAGFSEVAILTNDTEDMHHIHPGFRMNLKTSAIIAFALPMIDALAELLHKIRPYERYAGSADRAYQRGLNFIIRGIEEESIRGAERGFRRAIEIMNMLEYDRSKERPKVLIVGEYLLNFHPGANREIERYLERNGFEIIEAKMTDVIQKTYFYRDAQNKEYRLRKGMLEKGLLHVANSVFERAHELTDRIASAHPLYERATRLHELVRRSDPVIHHSFDAGEGVLIPGEILHHAEQGCRNFLILQPFGCLPNHIVGRGIMKKLKEMYPEAQILALDYDPDISMANIENRLQLLIMNAAAAQAAEQRAAERRGSTVRPTEGAHAGGSMREPSRPLGASAAFMAYRDTGELKLM